MAELSIIEGTRYELITNPTDPNWINILKAHDDLGADRPNRNLCKAVVAINDVGTSFYCIQPMIHAEPLFLHPNHRNTSILINLIAAAQALIEQSIENSASVFIVADKIETQKMCETLGLERVNSPVYRKKVTRER